MFRADKRGVASVEFAVVLPVLILLICGTVEFGSLLYNKQVVTNASREAVRAGITGQSDTIMRQIVNDYCGNRLISLKNEISSDKLSVEVVPPDADNDLTVKVSIEYDMLFARLIGIDQIQISAQTVMRMEPAI